MYVCCVEDLQYVDLSLQEPTNEIDKDLFYTLYSAYMKFVLTVATNTGEEQMWLFFFLVLLSDLRPDSSLEDQSHGIIVIIKFLGMKQELLNTLYSWNTTELCGLRFAGCVATYQITFRV